jgi:membrane-bound serine protease (ClpP class)
MEALGVALLVVAVALFLVEALTPTGGLIGLIGIGALVASGILLEVPWPVIVVVVLAIVALGALFGRKVWRAQRQERVLTGWEELIGAVGAVRVPLDPVGQVFVEGALWRARVDDGVAPVPAGSRVRVRAVDGLTLQVEPVPVEEGSPTAGSEDAEFRSAHS